MDQEKIKKPWTTPKLIKIEIKETENGGGYGLSDIAFQEMDIAEDISS